MADAHIMVRLQPRASRDELRGVHDGVLRARVTDPPVDGRANRALCRLIAERAGIAPSMVAVLRGERSREKLVAVQGMDAAELMRALARER